MSAPGCVFTASKSSQSGSIKYPIPHFPPDAFAQAKPCPILALGGGARPCVSSDAKQTDGETADERESEKKEIKEGKGSPIYHNCVRVCGWRLKRLDTPLQSACCGVCPSLTTLYSFAIEITQTAKPCPPFSLRGFSLFTQLRRDASRRRRRRRHFSSQRV